MPATIHYISPFTENIFAFVKAQNRVSCSKTRYKPYSNSKGKKLQAIERAIEDHFHTVSDRHAQECIDILYGAAKKNKDNYRAHRINPFTRATRIRGFKELADFLQEALNYRITRREPSPNLPIWMQKNAIVKHFTLNRDTGHHIDKC